MTTTTTTTPRVYVACLASYNNGILFGKWVDATDRGDYIAHIVEGMLGDSPTPNAEEWAIHDYEGFHGIKLSESESFTDVAELAQALEDNGAAFAAFYENNTYDGIGDALAKYEDAYRGEYDSEKDYAECYVDECCDLESMGELARYFDYEKFARDMFLDGHWSARSNDGVFVFQDN